MLSIFLFQVVREPLADRARPAVPDVQSCIALHVGRAFRADHVGPGSRVAQVGTSQPDHLSFQLDQGVLVVQPNLVFLARQLENRRAHRNRAVPAVRVGRAVRPGRDVGSVGIRIRRVL